MLASVFFFFIATASAQLMSPQSAVRERPLHAQRAPLAIRGGRGESAQARDVAEMRKYMHAVDIASVSTACAVGIAVGIPVHAYVGTMFMGHFLAPYWMAPFMNQHSSNCNAECTSVLDFFRSCYNRCMFPPPRSIPVSMERFLSFPSLAGLFAMMVCALLNALFVSLLTGIVAVGMRIIGLEYLRHWRPACFHKALSELPNWTQSPLYRRLQKTFGITFFPEIGLVHARFRG